MESEINAKYLGDIVKLRRDKTVIGNSAKPFVWTEKGIVLRRSVLNMYQKEIEALYA